MNESIVHVYHKACKQKTYLMTNPPEFSTYITGSHQIPTKHTAKKKLPKSNKTCMLVSKILIISFLFQYEFSFFLFFRSEIFNSFLEHCYIKKKIFFSYLNKVYTKKKRVWLEFINYQGIQLFWTWNNFSNLLSYILWHDHNSFLRNWDGQNIHTPKK